jgi:GT2 family glycosyltransferase
MHPRGDAPAAGCRRFGTPPGIPTVSVIVVAYRTGAELAECLASLGAQTDRDFECIVVDNGTEDPGALGQFTFDYYRLGRNHGPSYARNFGSEQAAGGILAFLDDDGIVDLDWIRNIKSAFADTTVVALRGRIIPKTDASVYNLVHRHYDLGDEIIDSPATTEGNSAVRRDVFRKAGGYDPTMFGHEGLELSCRIQEYGRLIYAPNVILRHDYSDSMSHFLRKEFRHARNAIWLRHERPQLEAYLAQFKLSGRAPRRADLTLWQRARLAFVLLLGRWARKLAANSRRYSRTRTMIGQDRA